MDKRIIHLGNLIIGSKGQMVPQTMLKCKTSNLSEVRKQLEVIKSYGIELVRVSILDLDDAMAVKTIKEEYPKINLIADIHYDYQLALKVMDNGIDKIRINPSNLSSKEQQKVLILKAKSQGIPIRIGLNSGSLYKGKKLDIDGLLLLLDEEVKLLESYDFFDIILSIKVNEISEAIILNKAIDEKYPYPIHLGITEAGNMVDATIKSSIFLSEMQKLGIGSTFRVSLNSTIENEVIVLKRILLNLGYIKGVKLIICPTCGRMQFNMSNYIKVIESICYHANKEISVALMGCVVNGPGEASSADMAIVGGVGKVAFYLKGVLEKTVSEEELIPTFITYFNKF